MMNLWLLHVAYTWTHTCTRTRKLTYTHIHTGGIHDPGFFAGHRLLQRTHTHTHTGDIHDLGLLAGHHLLQQHRRGRGGKRGEEVFKLWLGIDLEIV